MKSAAAGGILGERLAGGLDRLAFGLLVAFVVVMYTVPGVHFPWVEPLRPALVASGAAFALMALHRLGRGEHVYVDGVRGWSLALLWLLVVASTRWSFDREASVFHAEEIVKHVAIYLTMVNLITSSRRLVVLCAATVLVSIVTSIGVINWHREGVDLVDGFRARWVGTYADPNQMAMSIGIVVPLAAAFFMHRGQALLLRLLSAAAGVLALIAIVLSHSRGGFLGLLVGMGVWTLRERKPSRFALVIVLGMGMLLLAPQSFWSRTETVTHFEEDASAMGRVHAWTVTARANQDRPLLGVGAGAFRRAWSNYTPEAGRTYAAHNVFLQVLAELGVLGMALFLVFVGGTTGGVYRAGADPQHGWLARAIFASIAGYLVCSLFAGFLASPHLYVLLGLAACAHRIARSPSAVDIGLNSPSKTALSSLRFRTDKP